MGRRVGQMLVAGVTLAVVAAACGGDEGEVFSTTTAGSASTLAETTTTAAWGEEVAPGVEALVEGAQVMLREDFQDGDTAGWAVETGWYILTSGERRMAAAGGEAWAWYEEGLGWSRYGVRLGLMVAQGSLGVSVAVGEGGRYVVQLSEQGVHLLKDAPYGSIQALGSAQPVSLGEPHVLAVGVDGGHVQVYADGVLLIDATDPSPLSGGSIGLGAGAGSSVVVDTIVVAGLGGPLPQLQAVAEPADEPLPDQLADAAPDAGEELEAEDPGEPGLPNLVMNGVTLPPLFQPGEDLEVSMTVANTGDTDAGAFLVMFSASWEGACHVEVEALAAGEERMVGCSVIVPADIESFEWVAGADWRQELAESDEGDNQVHGTMGEIDDGAGDPLPNVALSWVFHRPNPAEVGDVIGIDVDIEQTNAAWTGTLPDLEVRVFHEDDGRLACGATVASGETTATCDIPAFDEPGSYTVRVEIDADGVLTEGDEDDNIGRGHSILVLESSSAVPDLHLDSVSFDPPLPEPDMGFQFRVDVAADPPAWDALYTVRLSIDGMLACSWDAEGAPSGLVCYTEPYPAGIHEWIIEIDADDDVAETDEGNNTAYGQFGIEG